jgi:hypothetical protein
VGLNDPWSRQQRDEGDLGDFESPSGLDHCSDYRITKLMTVTLRTYIKPDPDTTALPFPSPVTLFKASGGCSF